MNTLQHRINLAKELDQLLNGGELQYQVFEQWLGNNSYPEQVKGILETTLLILTDYFTRLDRMQGIENGDYYPGARVGAAQAESSGSEAVEYLIILAITTMVDAIPYSLNIGFKLDQYGKVVLVSIIESPQLGHVGLALN